MNLMEIGKASEKLQKETGEEPKNLPDTTDRWKKLAQEQAKVLGTVIAERNDLQMRCQDMEEFIQKLHEKLHSQRVEKQKLFLENQKLQEEIKNVHIQNVELERLINYSSVKAVFIAQKKQKETEEKNQMMEYQLKKIHERLKMEKRKSDIKLKKSKNEMKKRKLCGY